MGYIDMNYVEKPRANRGGFYEIAMLIAIVEKDPEAWSEMKKRIAEVDKALQEEKEVK